MAENAILAFGLGASLVGLLTLDKNARGYDSSKLSLLWLIGGCIFMLLAHNFGGGMM